MTPLSAGQRYTRDDGARLVIQAITGGEVYFGATYEDQPIAEHYWAEPLADAYIRLRVGNWRDAAGLTVAGREVAEGIEAMMDALDRAIDSMEPREAP